MSSIIFTWQSQVKNKNIITGYNFYYKNQNFMWVSYIFTIYSIITFLTAENLVEKYAISREAQDEYANKSQQQAKIAINAGYFDKEIVPVTITSKKESIVVSKDEFPKFETTVEKLAKLKPTFQSVRINIIFYKISYNFIKKNSTLILSYSI